MQKALATPGNLKYAPWAIAIIIVVLGLAIFMAMRHLRGLIVQQIAQRDSYVLYAASKVQIDPVLANDPELRPAAIENNALEAARLLTNILALRLYDSGGNPQFVFPKNVRTAQLSEAEFSRAKELKVANSFHEAALGDVFRGLTEQKTFPLLRAIVPLETSGGLIGVAEFLIDGRNVQAGIQALNRDLWRYGLVIFAISGGIIAFSLAAVFGRLEKSNKMLAQRTESLLRANHELTLAAKTSAVGAITAHLIHDLKSPLFGLQSFVQAKVSDSEGDDDWNLAFSTTQRMQKMINEIVRILQEEKTTADYEMTPSEVLDVLRNKLDSPAREAGLTLKCEGSNEGILDNRDANIVLLVLTNLAQNAIQATPKGGEIRLTCRNENCDLVFEVSDNGNGLPEHIRATIFTPSRSTKTGGTGLGLAISKQLANHAGAQLNLKESSEKGTVFELRLPERVLAGTADVASR